MEIKVKRENWKTGYHNVIRDEKGHFIKVKKWNINYTKKDFLEEIEEVTYKEEIYTPVYEEKRKQYKLVKKPIIPLKEKEEFEEWKTYFRWNLLIWESEGDKTPTLYNNNSMDRLVYHKGKVPFETLKDEVFYRFLPSDGRGVYRMMFRYHYFQAFWNGKEWKIDAETEKSQN